MTDQRLRDLERRGADPVRLLAERVRAGRLTRELLEVAAYCGHEPALSLLREDGPLSDPHHESGDWVFGLERWGFSVIRRVGAQSYWHVGLRDFVFVEFDRPGLMDELRARLTAWALGESA